MPLGSSRKVLSQSWRSRPKVSTPCQSSALARTAQTAMARTSGRLVNTWITRSPSRVGVGKRNSSRRTIRVSPVSGLSSRTFCSHTSTSSLDARVLQFADRLPGQVLVLPHHETGLPLGDAATKSPAYKNCDLQSTRRWPRPWPKPGRARHALACAHPRTGTRRSPASTPGPAPPATCRATDPPRRSEVLAGGVRSWPGNCRRGS